MAACSDASSGAVVFNITFAPRQTASSSLDALATAREPVVLTDSPLVASWPALTE